MPEQIPWERIPVSIRKFVKNNWPFTDRENREIFANDIMQAMKAEQEKAFHAGIELEYTSGASMNFETWYAKTYLK